MPKKSKKLTLNALIKIVTQWAEGQAKNSSDIDSYPDVVPDAIEYVNPIKRLFDASCPKSEALLDVDLNGPLRRLLPEGDYCKILKTLQYQERQDEIQKKDTDKREVASQLARQRKEAAEVRLRIKKTKQEEQGKKSALVLTKQKKKTAPKNTSSISQQKQYPDWVEDVACNPQSAYGSQAQVSQRGFKGAKELHKQVCFALYDFFGAEYFSSSEDKAQLSKIVEFGNKSIMWVVQRKMFGGSQQAVQAAREMRVRQEAKECNDFRDLLDDNILDCSQFMEAYSVFSFIALCAIKSFLNNPKINVLDVPKSFTAGLSGLVDSLFQLIKLTTGSVELLQELLAQLPGFKDDFINTYAQGKIKSNENAQKEQKENTKNTSGGFNYKKAFGL